MERNEVSLFDLRQLQFPDSPPAVVEKAKEIALHAWAVQLAGSTLPSQIVHTGLSRAAPRRARYWRTAFDSILRAGRLS
jgi:hypothetical protein